MDSHVRGNDAVDTAMVEATTVIPANMGIHGIPANMGIHGIPAKVGIHGP